MNEWTWILVHCSGKESSKAHEGGDDSRTLIPWYPLQKPTHTMEGTYIWMVPMWQGLIFKSGRQEDMCHNEIGLCARYIYIYTHTHQFIIINIHNGEAHLVCDYLKREKKILTSIVCNFCLWIPTLKLMICNSWMCETIFDVIKCP